MAYGTRQMKPRLRLLVINQPKRKKGAQEKGRDGTDKLGKKLNKTPCMRKNKTKLEKKKKKRKVK